MGPARAAALLLLLAAAPAAGAVPLAAPPADPPAAEEPAPPGEAAPTLEAPAAEPAAAIPDAAEDETAGTRRPGTDAVGLGDVLGRSEQAADEELRRSLIPFLPSTAPPVRPRTGTHFTAGVMGQLKTQNVSAETGFTQWNTDLEVTPGITFYSYGRKAQFTLVYAPRIYFPAVYHGNPPSVLNRAITRIDWTPSKAWTLAAWASGTAGDYSQLNPASTPGGPGPASPTVDPVRTYGTYPYLSVDVNASAAVTIREKIRLRFAGGWFDTGGIGEAGQAAQPRTWGPRADGTADLYLGTRTILSTGVAALSSQFVNGGASRILAGTETWSQRWSAKFDTLVTLGIGWVNNPPVAAVTVGNVIPVAGVKATFVQPSHDTIRFIGELGLGPYVDSYARAAYQRINWRLSGEWYMGRDWKFEGSLAGAYVPYVERVPESYAVLGGSATWAARRWLLLLAGFYAQTQLSGQAQSRFLQVTGYVSVAFQAPDLP